MMKRKSTTIDQGSSSNKVTRVVTRSVVEQFNWREKCFIYGQLCFKDKKHTERSNFVPASTLPIRENILNLCSQRNDNWTEEVRI